MQKCSSVLDVCMYSYIAMILMMHNQASMHCSLASQAVICGRMVAR